MKKTIKVHTTPEEVAKYRAIKQTIDIYRAKVDAANEALKAAYKVENRPMCGTLDTPGIFAPQTAGQQNIPPAGERPTETK